MPPLTREQLAARRRAQRQSSRRQRRAFLSASIPLVVVAGLVAIALGLSGGGGAPGGPLAIASPIDVVATAGERSSKLVIARAEAIDIYLPVSVERLTAAGYHPVSDPSAVALDPTGSIDHGQLARDDRPGPQTAGLDVGAPAGTTVYSPVDGVIASVSDYTVKGSVEGYQLTIQPAVGDGLVVRMSHLEERAGVEPPRVGEAVAAGETVLGQVRDFSRVGEQQLAELTSDAGNHVYLELVRTEVPAAS